MSVFPFYLDIKIGGFTIEMTTVLVLATIGLIVLCIWLVPLITSFHEELKFINMEIQRTEGREHAHWVKKRRRLWLSLLPFVRYH